MSECLFKKGDRVAYWPGMIEDNSDYFGRRFGVRRAVIVSAKWQEPRTWSDGYSAAGYCQIRLRWDGAKTASDADEDCLVLESDLYEVAVSMLQRGDLHIDNF